MKNFKFRFFPALTVVCFLSLMPTAFVLAGPIRTTDVKQVVSSNPNRAASLGSLQLVTSFQDPAAIGSGNDDKKKTESRVITEETIEITEEPCNCESEVAAFIVDKAGFPWWSLGFAGAAPIAFINFGKDEITPAISPTPFITPTLPPVGTPSPSPSLTPLPSPSPTPTGSPTPTPSGSPTPTPSVTPLPSPTPSITPTPNPSPSPTPSVSPTPTPNPSPSPTPSITPTPQITPTPIITPTPQVTPSGTPPNPVPEPMTILLFGTGLTGIGYAVRRMRNKQRDNDGKGKGE